VRTAIAVMAFGFLVARYNLFLKIAAESVTGGRMAADRRRRWGRSDHGWHGDGRDRGGSVRRHQMVRSTAASNGSRARGWIWRSRL
jgi:hypothetical protein